MLKQLKEDITCYLNAFTIYDYAAFIWLGTLFFILFLLALVLIRKKPYFSILLIVICLFLAFLGPVGVKTILDKTIRKNEIISKEVRKLHFSNSLIVAGELKNISKIKFKKCKIEALVTKASKNSYINYPYKLKPLKKKTIIISKEIPVNETVDFRIVFEDFKYKKDINVTINGECY